MKTFTKRLLGLALGGMILGACSQTATFEDADLMTEQAVEKAGFKLNPLSPNGFENAALADCNDCITEPQVATKVISKVTGNPQNPTVEPKGEFSVYNTVTDIVLEFHFYGTTGADVMTTNINGTNYSWSKDGAKDPAYSDVNLAGNGKILSFKITQALGVKDACTVYPTSVAFSGGDGGSLAGNLDYSIYEYCSDCDDEFFTYSATNENLDVVFSYNYSEKAEMTLTFTLPQAKIALSTGSTYYGADGKAYTVGGNGTNLTWIGDVNCSEDTPTTFAFNFAADCGPDTAKDGKANIWTNTEVKAINGVVLVDDPNTPENEGPYSLKKNLDNIVYSGCPTKD